MKILSSLLACSTLAFALFVSACHAPKAATSEEKIVRGHSVDENSPAYLSTVMLEMNGALCTGSIIAPRLILTAAHCVEGAQPQSIMIVFDKFKQDDPRYVRTGHRSETFKPTGSASFPNFDIAYVELDSDVPAPYAPIEILRDPSLIEESTPILLAGYGQTEDNCNDDTCVGQLKEANTKFLQYYDQPHLMSLLIFHGVATEGYGAACHGDSGGPAFAQFGSKWLLIGVTNGTRPDIVPESDGSCGNGWDIYTFAGDYVRWLEQSSGQKLVTPDELFNPARNDEPLVVTGPSQARPTTWDPWVNYANHEDGAWFTVDNLLQQFIADRGRISTDTTKLLLDGSLTQDDFAKLSTVELYGPTITDLSPLALASNLKELQLYEAPVKDLKSLGAVRANISSLGLAGSPSTLLSGTDWKAFSSLQELRVDGTADIATPKMDWSNFGGLTALAWNGIPSNLPDFSRMPNLVDLSLENDGLTTLSGLALPATLQTLDVSGNNLKGFDLSSGGLVKLTAFDTQIAKTATCPAKSCFLDTYTDPKSMTEICTNAVAALRNGYQQSYFPTLILLQAQIIGQISNSLDCALLDNYLPRIRGINLQGQGLTDIRPLAFLPANTQSVAIDGNRIEDIKPLFAAKGLLYVSAAENHIKTLPSQSAMTRLRSLNVLDNPIAAARIDAPQLSELYIGTDPSSEENGQDLDLSFAAQASLGTVYVGKAQLGADSLKAIHDLPGLYTLALADQSEAGSKDFDDELSLDFFSSLSSLDSSCAIINGSCGSLTSQAQVLGPLLGTTSGSRDSVSDDVVHLPGLENPIILEK